MKENVTNGKADNHEGIDFYKSVENPDKTKPLWGENQWPSVPGFKEKYEAWVEKMKALGMITMQAWVSSNYILHRGVLTLCCSMAVGLGMTEEEWQDLRGQVDDSFWVMRVIGQYNLSYSLGNFSQGRAGYPPLPNDHDGFSCGAHK